MDHFGITLGSIWRYFWHVRMTLDHFGVTMGPLWGHFRHLKATLDHFGVALVHLGITLEPCGTHFGVIFGLLLAHFGIALHTLGSLWNRFGYMKVLFESLWPVFKKLIFPIDFNDLMQLWGQHWTRFDIEIPFALAFSLALALAFALKLRLHLHLHLHFHFNLHLHGQIRFWTGPFAKVTSFAE